MTAKTDILGPKTAPDQVSITRLRRVLRDHFDEIPLLEAHLALLDSRGVLYATHAAANWAQSNPDTFFGLVRHVVRTQSDDAPPDPDVEGWLAAGRPSNDQRLGDAWDLINVSRYSTDPLPATPRPTMTSPEVERFDEVLRQWPAHVATFATAYWRVEWAIEARGIELPPITG